MPNLSIQDAALQICKVLNLEPTKLVGSRKKVSVYSLILSLISVSSIQEASELLGISRNTLKTIIYNNLDSYGSTNRAFTWDLYLLSLIGHKLCTKCLEIKPFNAFNTDRSKTLGITARCKTCSYEYSKEYRALNRESYLAYLQQYRIEHAKDYLARTRKYKLSKSQRVPSWADIDKIKAIYRACPEGCHVDHIIPLNGDTVSGLHVENNLQYLLAEDNIAKSNKFTAS